MKKSLLVCALSAIFTAYSLPISAETPQVQAPHTTHQSESAPPFTHLKTDIVKSPNDKAIYTAIRLQNGMEVLLISDPKANKSLASAAIPIGSMEDPESQLGLAHYLEHMVFMGSKQFPQVNGLDEYLAKNGGYNNASTTASRTAYYLQVNHEAFDGAVARFADMLAAPLLRAKDGKKEVNAVNAEMVRAKSRDYWMWESIEQATRNPAHPRAKFSVGNKETLSDKKDSQLNVELVKFHQKYYSANLFKAVLYSDQPIEKLAKLASNTFGKMENKEISVPEINVPLYRAEDKGVVISYKPIKPKKSVEIVFDMPNDHGKYWQKSNEYLAYIFANPSEGTLSDYLIKNGLSDSGLLAQGENKLGREDGGFSFYVELTDKGWAEKDKVISLIFQQIEKVKKDGIQDIYFNELKTSLSQAFEHLQVEKNGDYVESLAEQMLRYPLQGIIDADYDIRTMDKTEIREKLDQMTLDNARILLTGEVKTNKTTPYMHTAYAIEKIRPEQREKWLDFSQSPTVNLPKPNSYFATDFRLNTNDHTRTVPAQIEAKAGTATYAMPSHAFPTEPKAITHFEFLFSDRLDDVNAQISAAALGYMQELAQAEIAAQASVAGMHYDVGLAPNRINVSFNGYTQHLTQLAQDVLTKTAKFPLTESQLAQAKERILEALNRQEKDSTQVQALLPLKNLSAASYFSPEHQREAVKTLTLADVEKMRQRLLTQATGVKALSVGDLTDTQVNTLTQQLENVVKNQQREIAKYPRMDFSHVTDKITLTKNVPHEDNALYLVYLAPTGDEIHQSVTVAMLKSIISRWYFDELRTAQQLGYVAHASGVNIGESHGLQFLVVSPTATPTLIMERNNTFLKESLLKLQHLSEEEFEQYRTSLLDKLQQKPESLSEEFEQFTHDFNDNNAKFDRLQKQIAALKTLTKQEMIDFYKAAVIDQSGFVLASQVIGNKATPKDIAVLEGFKKITDLESYHHSLPRSWK